MRKRSRTLSGIRAALLVAVGTFLWVPPAGAQVNIEKIRGDEKEKGLSGVVKLDLSSKSGNTDLTELDVAARGDFDRGRNSTFLVIQIDYGWEGGDAFSDEGLAHLRHAYVLNGPLAVEAFTQSDYNKSRLLDKRFIVGGGLRVNAVERKRAKVAVGTSYMFEHEELELPAGATHAAETDVNRWSSYLSVSVALGGRAKLSSTGYVQPQVDRFSDVRVVSDSTVAVDLGAGFALAVTFRLRHDSKPPDDIDTTDTTLATGLALAF